MRALNLVYLRDTTINYVKSALLSTKLPVNPVPRGISFWMQYRPLSSTAHCKASNNSSDSSTGDSAVLPQSPVASNGNVLSTDAVLFSEVVSSPAGAVLPTSAVLSYTALQAAKSQDTDFLSDLQLVSAKTNSTEQTAPKFSELWANIPTMASPDFIKLVGGHVESNYKTNPKMKNTCAMRMSYAFNMSGYVLPALKDATISGYIPSATATNKELKWFIYRVATFRDYMNKNPSVFGRPQTLTKKQVNDIANTLAGQTGILIFLFSRTVTGRGMHATGHITLWNGTGVPQGAYQNDYSQSAALEPCLFYKLS